jgi:signal transduction histidine kinase
VEWIGRNAEEIFQAGIPLPLNVFRGSENAAILDMVRIGFEINDRSIQTSMAPVHTSTGELLGVVAVLRDVTRERQAERAKTEFIATISHELRTPLTAIKGYADLIHSGATGDLNEIQQGFIGKVCNQANHLIFLINEIIQYSELERGGLTVTAQSFDLSQVIAEAVEANRKRLAEKEFTLTLHVPPRLTAYGDPARTMQIIEQLLDNAIRFTPAPGQITLTAERHEAHVSVAVSDTGVGIAPKDIERIFERFYRPDNAMQVTAGGLGLGLTIARALAAAQGGRLWAHSPAGLIPPGGPLADQPGATLTLELPALPPQS